MGTATYQTRRYELKDYFDRTAVDAWARLTSTAPVSKIRATVRAGRDRMRATLLDCLPADLHGLTVLDAGCGTGALATAAAQRGASVVAVDLSPTLIELAKERLPAHLGVGQIDFLVGDMLDPGIGEFDHVVAMDSLIHYQLSDVVRVLVSLAARTRHSMAFTFAPSSPALELMLAAGKLFPRRDRSPRLEPISERELRRALTCEPALASWTVTRSSRITSGFYKSHAIQLVKQ